MFFPEEIVQSRSQIRRSVSQGAVQIEKNRLDHDLISRQAGMQQVIDTGISGQDSLV